MQDTNEEGWKYSSWIRRWRKFFDDHPNGKPEKVTRWSAYLSQIKQGVGSWHMTAAFWFVLYEKTTDDPRPTLEEIRNKYFKDE